LKFNLRSLGYPVVGEEDTDESAFLMVVLFKTNGGRSQKVYSDSTRDIQAAHYKQISYRV
jgi:hypothetical protein